MLPLLRTAFVTAALRQGQQPPVVDPSLLGGDPVSGASAGVPLSQLLGVALVALVLGVVIGALGYGALIQLGFRKNRAKWPRDWPKARDIFTKDGDPTKPGYMALSPQRALGSGAMPLGRTYPRLHLIPDVFPLRELRRRMIYWTSRPVWVPYEKRFQHTSILGATGKGKSTSYAIPFLAYGALEPNTSYFAIDVKSPAFTRMFSRLYKNAGKETLFLDPWSPTETLAFEPVWRANEESKDIIAEVIATYSAEAKSMSSSENSEFFKLAATRTLRALLDLAQFWPRRYCNLPCIQQAIGAGGNVLKEAFEKAPQLMPKIDELIAAIEILLPVSDEELRSPRRPDMLSSALGVLDRAGYKTAFAVKRMRQYEQRFEEEGTPDEKRKEIRDAFWAQVRHEWNRRKEHMNAMLMNVGEFLAMPDDTRNSVVSTITNKTNWFKDPNIARTFSRDELDVRTLVTTPCLFLVGAPMAKLKVGSLFVASIISNLVTYWVFQRGMAIERGQAVSKHGVFLLFDEFPQLNIKDGPSILATFRGFKSGVIMVFQERGQLRQLYGDDATTMEGNTVHKILLQGAHEETAEFYAQKAIGEVEIVKRSRSGVSGEKKSISESAENVPLMTTQDVKSMRLNGKVRTGMALSVGADVPAFPIRPVPFYEDPTMRQLLGLKKTVSKKGADGRKTWKFWRWSERWEPGAEEREYQTRRPALSPQERADGRPDPVYDRRMDPYTQLLDYVLGKPKGPFDELTEPRLALRDVGVIENAPSGTNVDAPGGAHAAHTATPHTNTPSGPVLPVTALVPNYAPDFRVLINGDFSERGAVPGTPPAFGGDLEERLAAFRDYVDSEGLDF